MASPSTSAALPSRRTPLPLSRVLVPLALFGWLVGLGVAAWRDNETWFGRLLDWPIYLGVALFPLLVVLELAGMIRLFGPVLYFDLVRQARRLRYVLIRFLYAAGLFVMVCWVYWRWTVEHSYRPMSANQLPEFSQSFFLSFLVVQSLLVLALTPAYTAGAITDEKERKTLQFLLATDLFDREIVFSKLLARIINILLAVLVGLPILSLLQLIGGIDPGLLLASFGATCSVVISLAALSLLNSTLLKRSRDAILLTYLTPPIYVLVSTLGRVGLPALLSLYDSSWLLWPGTASEPSFLNIQNLLYAFSAGDPFFVTNEGYEALTSPGSGITLWDLTRNFMLFHGYLAVICTAGSLLMLRRQALKEASESPGRRLRWNWRFPRPAVGNLAMIWKEVWAERGLQMHLLAWVGLLGLVAISFLPSVLLIDHYFERSRSNSYSYARERELHEGMNVNIRIVGTGVASLMLLGVAVRAAGSISGERNKETFDTLLTTPLESSEILLGKLIGSLTSVRWMLLWLGALWFLALITGGLSPAALPLLTGSWLVYAIFCALVGIWYSMTCSNTMRATVATLFTLLGLGLGHWLIWMCCLPLFAFGNSSANNTVEFVAKCQAGLTPPFAFGVFAFYGEEVKDKDFQELFVCSIGGTIVWGLGSVALWALINERFSRITHRSKAGTLADQPMRRPRPNGPPARHVPPPSKHIQVLDDERPPHIQVRDDT